MPNLEDIKVAVLKGTWWKGDFEPGLVGRQYGKAFAEEGADAPMTQAIRNEFTARGLTVAISPDGTVVVGRNLDPNRPPPEETQL